MTFNLERIVQWREFPETFDFATRSPIILSQFVASRFVIDDRQATRGGVMVCHSESAPPL